MSHHPRPKFTRAKIIILGGSQVGKTAFTVRYLTNRFIGDYEPSKEMLYTHKNQYDKDEVTMELLDTAHDSDKDTLTRNIKWADGFILMYSITNKDSYKTAQQLHKNIAVYRQIGDCTPMVLVGNKTDASIARQISESEGEELARKFDCPLYEISTSESYEGVQEVMGELIRQLKREFVKNSSGCEKTSKLTGVKRILRKKIYRSRSDTT